MRVKISFILVVMILFGCASNDKVDAMSSAAKETKAPHQVGVTQVQGGANELVAMLCSPAKIMQAKQLIQQHNVTLVKQSSPTILALSWSDERSAKQVIQSLQKSNSVFCGIESNQIYTTQ
jgi:hypothetical protein